MCLPVKTNSECAFLSLWKNVSEKEKKLFALNLQNFQLRQDGWKTFFMKTS